ncbi:MAG: phospholipase D-like domain-containing protein [Haloarculaceae archaeon]
MRPILPLALLLCLAAAVGPSVGPVAAGNRTANPAGAFVDSRTTNSTGAFLDTQTANPTGAFLDTQTANSTDASAGGAAGVRVVAAYPNPAADGDRGEFVVLAVPPAANLSGATLSDGETTVALDGVEARGRVALAADPAAANVTNATVVGAPDLALANGGERLVLRAGGTVRDRAVYRDAPTGEVATWNGTRVRWRPLGATDRPVIRATGGTIRAFVLPDDPGPAVAPIRDADDRVLLAGYTLTSERVADALANASRRGARVRVLLEGGPIGGLSRREARLLDRLVTAGVEVRLIGGPLARYDYHHAKYLVADDRAVVLTENWKPAGVGGADSRGWGVVTNQSAIVDGLTATFRADAGWRDAIPWRRFRRGRSFERRGQATGSFPTRTAAQRVPVDRTELLVAPDNAGDRLVALLDGAEESVDVEQMSLQWDGSLARALRRAAARGVAVRILLSDAWYVREDNQRVAAQFRQWADEHDAPLQVRLADPAGRYGKIHAKGAIVDDRAVVLGSLNWNDPAATSNREVVLVLHGARVGDYYGSVFAGDWRGGHRGLPAGLAIAAGGVLLVAALVARRIEFD